MDRRKLKIFCYTIVAFGFLIIFLLFAYVNLLNTWKENHEKYIGKQVMNAYLINLGNKRIIPVSSIVVEGTEDYVQLEVDGQFCVLSYDASHRKIKDGPWLCSSMNATVHFSPNYNLILIEKWEDLQQNEKGYILSSTNNEILVCSIENLDNLSYIEFLKKISSFREIYQILYETELNKSEY